MKEWLKYGIIVSILGTIFTIIGLATNIVCQIGESCPQPLINRIVMGLIYPLQAIFNLSGYPLLFGTIIYYFVIGALIGLIIQKIKSKNQ